MEIQHQQPFFEDTNHLFELKQSFLCLALTLPLPCGSLIVTGLFQILLQGRMSDHPASAIVAAGKRSSS